MIIQYIITNLLLPRTAWLGFIPRIKNYYKILQFVNLDFILMNMRLTNFGIVILLNLRD